MHSAAAMIAVPATRQIQFSARSLSRRASSSVRCQASQVGDKVLPLLRSPTDVLFLGPRLALGALLSVSQNVERLPADLERLSAIAADPRPMEQKQNEILLEIEDRVAGLLERGLTAENEVIATVNGIIPDDVKAALPEDLRKAVLTPRPLPQNGINNGTVSYQYQAPNSAAGGDQGPMATWTISSVDELDEKEFGPSAGATASWSRPSVPGAVAPADEPPVSFATVGESQAAAELVEIQTAVLFLKDQLAAVQGNEDASKISMLKLNLREATQSLKRRLEQRAVPVAGQDPAVAAAVKEAQDLLEEVEALG